MYITTMHHLAVVSFAKVAKMAFLTSRCLMEILLTFTC